jgi:hypothetical protein
LPFSSCVALFCATNVACVHLRAADHHAVVALLDDVHEDVLHVVHGLGAVDRRVDEHVVEEQRALRVLAVPVLGAAGERPVPLGIGTQAGHEGRLVVGRATHEAVGHARPDRERLARVDEVLRRVRRREEPVRPDAAPIGDQHVVGGIVQCVVEARDGAGGIAERRVLGDVGDLLAADPDLPAVPQALQVLIAGERLVECRCRHLTPLFRLTER